MLLHSIAHSNADADEVVHRETCRSEKGNNDDGNNEGQDNHNKDSDADSDDVNNDEDFDAAEDDSLPEESDGASLAVPQKMGRGQGGDLSTLLHKGLRCSLVK